MLVDIERYFSKYGKIKDITYGRDKNTGRRLGFCILEFETTKAASAALSSHTHYIIGKKVKVQPMLLRHELKRKHSHRYRAPGPPKTSSSQHSSGMDQIGDLKQNTKKSSLKKSSNAWSELGSLRTPSTQELPPSIPGDLKRNSESNKTLKKAPNAITATTRSTSILSTSFPSLKGEEAQLKHKLLNLNADSELSGLSSEFRSIDSTSQDHSKKAKNKESCLQELISARAQPSIDQQFSRGDLASTRQPSTAEINLFGQSKSLGLVVLARSSSQHQQTLPMMLKRSSKFKRGSGVEGTIVEERVRGTGSGGVGGLRLGAINVFNGENLSLRAPAKVEDKSGLASKFFSCGAKASGRTKNQDDYPGYCGGDQKEMEGGGKECRDGAILASARHTQMDSDFIVEKRINRESEKNLYTGHHEPLRQHEVNSGLQKNQKNGKNEKNPKSRNFYQIEDEKQKELKKEPESQADDSQPQKSDPKSQKGEEVKPAFFSPTKPLRFNSKEEGSEDQSHSPPNAQLLNPKTIKKYHNQKFSTLCHQNYFLLKTSPENVLGNPTQLDQSLWMTYLPKGPRGAGWTTQRPKFDSFSNEPSKNTNSIYKQRQDALKPPWSQSAISSKLSGAINHQRGELESRHSFIACRLPFSSTNPSQDPNATEEAQNQRIGLGCLGGDPGDGLGQNHPLIVEIEATKGLKTMQNDVFILPKQKGEGLQSTLSHTEWYWSGKVIRVRDNHLKTKLENFLF